MEALKSFIAYVQYNMILPDDFMARKENAAQNRRKLSGSFEFGSVLLLCFSNILHIF